MFILLTPVTRDIADREFIGQLLRVKTSVYSFFFPSLISVRIVFFFFFFFFLRAELFS